MKATSRTGKPIVIADYDPAWAETFNAERELIFETVGRELFVRIEHIGSTSVPALAAKPIIDLMPGVRSLADVTPEVIARFESISYEYVPEYEQPNDVDEGAPERRYFRKDSDGVRAFHNHVVEHRSAWWVRTLRFRNCMRVFPSLMREYEALKRGLAADYNAKMGADWGWIELNLHYTENKSEFVERVLAMAEERIARSNPIVLAPYDPAWPRLYQTERAILAKAVGDFAEAIEHVGSTSVPGLCAKPQVDIAMGLSDMDDAGALSEPLNALGYENLPLNENKPQWIVYSKSEAGHGSVNLHIVPHNGWRWRDYLAFRDHLRAHPADAQRYETLKRELVEEFGSDRIGYPEAKADFVAEILQRARDA